VRVVNATGLPDGKARHSPAGTGEEVPREASTWPTVTEGLALAALALAVLAAFAAALGGGAPLPLSVSLGSVAMVLLALCALVREAPGPGSTRSNSAGVLIRRWVP
jgi:hypothetical protein